MGIHRKSSVCLIVVIILLLSGCRKVDDDYEAVAESFLKTYYEVSKTDIERYNDYVLSKEKSESSLYVSELASTYEEFVTKKELQRLLDENQFWLIVQLAHEYQIHLKVSSMALVLDKKEDEAILCNYTLKLVVENKPGIVIETIGELVLEKENRVYMITSVDLGSFKCSER